jgi:periplasmic divalent cation tolerance protein
MLIVFTTVPDKDSARTLAEKIVGSRMAACVQIMPRMTSVYLWNGEMREEDEHLLLIKTLPAKYDELEKFIAANHSYEVPEIAAVDAAKVSEGYSKWLDESVS